MNITTDEKHRATLQVLADVLLYLKRLPPVVPTLEMCRTIEAHLQEPAAVLLKNRETERRGAYVSPLGFPLLEASLLGDALTVRINRDQRGQTLAAGSVSVQLGLVDGCAYLPPMDRPQEYPACTALPAPVQEQSAAKRPADDMGLHYE